MTEPEGAQRKKIEEDRGTCRTRSTEQWKQTGVPKGEERKGQKGI